MSRVSCSQADPGHHSVFRVYLCPCSAPAKTLHSCTSIYAAVRTGWSYGRYTTFDIYLFVGRYRYRHASDIPAVQSAIRCRYCQVLSACRIVCSSGNGNDRSGCSSHRYPDRKVPERAYLLLLPTPYVAACCRFQVRLLGRDDDSVHMYICTEVI